MCFSCNHSGDIKCHPCMVNLPIIWIIHSRKYSLYTQTIMGANYESSSASLACMCWQLLLPLLAVTDYALPRQYGGKACHRKSLLTISRRLMKIAILLEPLPSLTSFSSAKHFMPAIGICNPVLVPAVPSLTLNFNL